MNCRYGRCTGNRTGGLIRRVMTTVLVGCFLLGALAPAAVGKEPATPELSLQEAVGLALKNSEAVKKASRDIDKNEEWRNYRADQLDYVPLSPPGNAPAEIAWASILQADLTWRMSKKSLTAEEDAVTLDTCKKYWEVLKGQEKVESAEVALNAARRQLQSARAFKQVGISVIPNTPPGLALTSAEAGYRAAEAALMAARNGLDTAYISFNQAVGLWPEDRPVLTDTVTYEPVEITSLDYEVTKVMENSPAVWYQQEMVTMQKYLEDMMFYTGEYRPYQARKIEVEQAELNAAGFKKLTELSTRARYYGLLSREEAYSGLEKALQAREESLRIVKLKFDLGMATVAEVANAEKELASIKSDLFEMACDHAYDKLAFQKPWAAR